MARKPPTRREHRIEYRPLSGIRADPRNPKAHEVGVIDGSMRRFGFIEPIVVDDRTGMLISGHGRTETLTAMHAAGEPPPAGVRVAGDDWEVPVTVGWASADDVEASGALIALNRAGELGGWVDEALLGSLDRLRDETSLDGVGYTSGDVDALRALLAGSGFDEELPEIADPDHVPTAPSKPVTKRGDVWRLGPHRVICGDCRDIDDVRTLMDGALVNVAFTSPPYASQRKYDEDSEFLPIPVDEYVEWFAAVQANVRDVLAEDGSWFVNIKENAEGGQRVLYVKDLTIAHVREWGWMFVDELCWVHGGLPGTWDNRHKNQFEPIFHFSSGRYIKFHPLANGIESRDSFTYSGALEPASTGNPISWSGSDVDREQGMALPGNVLQVGKSREPIKHEAAFPARLPAWFIRAYSDPGDNIFDPFMGSGTTLIAAASEGRIAYGAEISPRYVDVICRRYQEATGTLPTRDGEPHDFTND